MGWGSRLALVLVLGLGTLAHAAPHTPSNDAAVLETLPTQWQTLAPSPNLSDDAAVAAQVRRYIEIGRETADPRYYGYAEALLKPWWNALNPPADLLLLRATLRQHAHAYPAAVQDLRQLLTQSPQQTQGWLTLAVVQTELKEYAAAQQSCAALAVHASLWHSSLCHSHVMSLNGEAESAYRLQATLLPTLGTASDAETLALRQWIHTLMAETAVRLGKHNAAEQHFQDALTLPRHDPYLLRVYSDWLLSQQRPLEVIKLLQAQTHDDALLLRLAIASRNAQQTAETARYQTQLTARYAAARLRGSDVHATDEALYRQTFGITTAGEKP